MADIDKTIEQLAFGAAGRAVGSSLGMYLSPDVVYLAESHVERSGKLVVDHLVHIPIATDVKNPAGTATMSTDFLKDPLKVAGTIRQTMSQMRWNSKRVRVSLSHHLGLMRYFTMPDMERRYLRTAVPLEAKKYIPIPFDVLAHDFQAIPLAPDAQGKPHVGVLIAVTQKKNLACIQGLLDSLGLTLDGLEVAPCSVFRLWQAIDPPKGPEPFAHVHIDGGAVRVAIFDQGFPVFFREVFLGYDAAVSDQRKIDLSGCLSFAQKQLGVPGLVRVRVSGTTPELEELRAAFAVEAGVEAVIQDIPQLLSVKRGDWGGYAALGASALFQVATPVRLNLAAVDLVTDEELRTARDILLLASAFSLFLMGTGLLKTMTYHYRARELKQYRIDADVSTAFAGLGPLDIDARLGEMKSQLDALSALTSGAGRPKLSVMLKEIIECMPTKVWLDRITVSNSLAGAVRRPVTIILKGRAQDQGITEEQALAFTFNGNLIKNPILGKMFDSQISLQKGADIEMSAQRGMSPAALAARLEDRTSFTLTMTGKR
ncbi:MAG: pilus assembly protein PilM [Elusimicrobiota bacterium]